MCLFMNSFAALNTDQIGVEDLSRTLIKQTRITSLLALSLYRCSTVISIGCPGIIWSLKLLACLVSAPLHTNSAAKERRFSISLSLLLVMTWKKSWHIFFARVLNFGEFKYHCWRRNLCSWRKKAWEKWKNQACQDSNPDLCDTGAVH